MSSIWGSNIQISIFGESHSAAIGVVINGLPAGLQIDLNRVSACIRRRMPSISDFSTSRKEADAVEIVSGFFNGYTTGTPLTGIIRNQDAHSNDYNDIKDKPRPSHADFTGHIKYRGFQDYRGGGHFSGRLTAPLVFAGSIAEQLIEKYGILVSAHILSIGEARDVPFAPDTEMQDCNKLKLSEFAVIDPDAEQKMMNEIKYAKNSADSIGGIVECIALGIPAGIGDPIFGTIESIVSGLFFSVPGVKGVEFGAGFNIAKMRGSSANDCPVIRDDKIVYKTNNNGGILGGISNGMPLLVRAAIKPTPSIAANQETVDLVTGTNTTIQIKGRHDACIVPRAVEVLRCALALSLADLLLEDKKYE